MKKYIVLFLLIFMTLTPDSYGLSIGSYPQNLRKQTINKGIKIYRVSRDECKELIPKSKKGSKEIGLDSSFYNDFMFGTYENVIISALQKWKKNETLFMFIITDDFYDKQWKLWKKVMSNQRTVELEEKHLEDKHCKNYIVNSIKFGKKNRISLDDICRIFCNQKVFKNGNPGMIIIAPPLPPTNTDRVLNFIGKTIKQVTTCLCRKKNV